MLYTQEQRPECAAESPGDQSGPKTPAGCLSVTSSRTLPPAEAPLGKSYVCSPQHSRNADRSHETTRYARGSIAYYGYCGVLWHSDREAVSSTLVDVMTRAGGYPGTRGCFLGVKKMTRYCNTRRLMAKHRHRQTAEYAGAQTTAAPQR